MSHIQEISNPAEIALVFGADYELNQASERADKKLKFKSGLLDIINANRFNGDDELACKIIESELLQSYYRESV